MKKLTLLLFCFLFMIQFDSCKKKDNSDENPIKPLQPLPYLPVYPGSYWKYVSGDHTYITKTSDNYIEFQGLYLTTLGMGSGLDPKIKGYYEWFDAGYQNQGWHRIFSETVGDSWSNSIGRWPFYYNDQEIFQVMQLIIDQQGDSSIIQRYRIRYQNDSTHFQGWTWQKFKRNIGKVCEFSVDTLTKDTTYSLVLIDYYINH